MGCFPSRQRSSEGSVTEDPSETRTGGSSEDSKKNAKPNLTPTVQMVNDETLRLLQEIGELKVFNTANTDCKKNLAVHHDIMLALENPKSIGNATNSPAELVATNVK